MAKVLIAGKAANCRRVETQSGGPTHLAIDYRCQHLALKSAERRRFAKMKVAIQRAGRPRDLEIDREDLKHTRHDTAILTPHPAKEELPEPSGPFRHDRHDIRHSSPSRSGLRRSGGVPADERFQRHRIRFFIRQITQAVTRRIRSSDVPGSRLRDLVAFVEAARED